MYVSPLLRARAVITASLGLSLCCLALAQPGMPTGPNYTDDMPSVAKVQSTIQGSDPTDTAARQVTVFEYLVQYINRVQTDRDPTKGYTLGEAKLIGDYNGASAQITQDFTKSHTADQVKTFQQLQGKYLFDDTFMSAWPKQLIGQQAATAIQNADAGLNASAQHMYNQQTQQYQQAQQAQPQTGAGQAGLMSTDPTEVAIRRCLELGGSTDSCMGGGLLNGLVGMFTGGAGLNGLTGPGRAGVVLSGDYGTGSGAAYLSFSGDSASINNCGKLVPNNLGYTLRKAANSLQVTLASAPSPILLTMRSDGSLSGPGPVSVTGQIITGYQTVTSTQMINGVRAAPGQCNGPCQTVSQVPVYAAATDRCTLGALAAPPPLDNSTNSTATSPAAGGLFGALMSTMASVVTVSLPGLRMEGKYGSSGLQLDFAGDAVTLDCGQAHVKSPYTVENAVSALIVHVQNTGGPFDLTVSSDNTLRGSGSTTINGRLVSAVNGDTVTFSPHSETCQLGTYAPQTGLNSTTTVATNPSPTPPPTSSAPTGGTQASIRLTISTSFAGTNLLANQSVFVMKEPIGQVLQELGVSVPSGATAGQAMEALKTQCHTQSGCSSVMSGLNSYFVKSAKLDGSGKVTLAATAATGTYYIYAIVPQGAAALMWDVSTSVKAGDNSVTLTASNSEQVP